MEKLRRRKSHSLLLRSALLAGLIPAASLVPSMYAQSSPALRALLDRAKNQDAHGHPEIAVQTWQQVLLSDPENREALTALARVDMQLGNTEEARGYLQRLRSLGGDASEARTIASMPTVASRDARLDQATREARAGNYASAARIYEQVFGDDPPPGNWALTYYDTEAALPGRRQHAIDGLKRLAQQFPGESRYSITLGRILTYDAKTRAEGIALLSRYPDSQDAQKALRQAQGWDVIRQQPVAPQQAAAGETSPTGPRVVTDSKDAIAYRELNSGHLEEAERGFRAILAGSPHSASALSGMGYVRLKQHQFSEAADYLSRAQGAGAKGHGFEEALGLAHFWTVMSRAADEQKAGQLSQSLSDYRSAQQMRPGSPEAAEGAAGVLLQQGDSAGAASLYQQAVQTAPTGSPVRTEAWRGLVLADSAAGNDQAALDASARTPAAIENSLQSDPAYLAALYRSAKAAGNTTQANALLSRVLSLPFPNHGRDLPVARQMEYANLLASAQKENAALALYRQVLQQDPENQDAWLATLSAEHAMGNDEQALAMARQISPATLQQLEARGDFLALIGSLYSGMGDGAQAQRYLARALTAAKGQSGDRTGIMLQLAALDAQQGNLDAAYRLYTRVLEGQPQNAAAWAGVVNTLHLAHRDREALEKIAGMSEETRLRLDGDPAFQQVLASVEAGAGNTRAAMQVLERLDQSYSARQQAMPVDARIQYGWLLNQQGADRRLYSLVQQLAVAPDLTAAQRASFRQLVAAFTMRRGSAEIAAGRTGRGLSLLEAAHQTFPDNRNVSDALAGAYQQAGQPRQALALYQGGGMESATLPQYRGAIGAALAAGDQKDAADWLQAALSRYATDPALLRMAAQYEQARGDSRKAAAYYRAALQMMGSEAGQGSLTEPVAGQGAGASLLQMLAPETAAPSRGSNLLGLPQQNLQDLPSGQDPLEQQSPRTGVPRTQTLGDLLGPSADSLPVGMQPLESQPAERMADAAPAERTRPGGDSLDAEPLSEPLSESTMSAATPGDNLLSAAAPQEDSDAVDNLSFAPPTEMGQRRHAARLRQDPSAADPLPSLDAPSYASSSYASPASTPEPAQLASAPTQSDAIPDTFAPVVDPADAHPLVLRNVSNVQPQNPVGADDGSQLETAVTALQTGHRGRGHHVRSLQTLPPITAARATAGRAPDPSLNTPQYGATTQYGAGDSATAMLPGAPIASTGYTGSGLLASLPPIRGPYQAVPQPALTPREQVQQQLELIESGSSGWLGGTSSINYRSGQPGLDQLSIYSARIESSAMMGPDVRLSVVTQPVLLDAGTATGTATVRQGTLPLTATPQTQSASGVGGELQLRASSFGASIGYTPYQFLVSNAIGSVLIAPAGAHFSLSLSRSAVEDTQLSYAGLRDTGSQSALYSGNIWGGVVSNAGELQISGGNQLQGWYIQGGGQYLTGYHVPDNQRADGDAGAYWRVWQAPSYGSVTVGANFFGMHYAKNLRYFTYGQGGYFSPSAYLLGNVPVTVNGHYGNRFHYQVVGSLGVQAFNESSAPYFPLDLATQIAQGNPYYPEQTSVGANYDLQSEGSYAISDHWYVGGTLNANNSRDYDNVRAGFYVRYMFRPQPALGETGPTGLFPLQGLRPLRVP